MGGETVWEVPVGVMAAAGVSARGGDLEEVIATALHDFQGMHLSNVPLSKGEIVRVLGADQNGWIHVEVGGETGQVPTAYLAFGNAAESS